MEFFNIGTGELLFIALLAILVVGPKRSVQLMQQAGRLLARLQKEWRSIQRDILTEVQAVQNEVSLDTSTWITPPKPVSHTASGEGAEDTAVPAKRQVARLSDGTNDANGAGDATRRDAAGEDASHS